MGIDVDSKLMVGCSYGELEEFFERIIEKGDIDEHGCMEDASDVIEAYFEYASPYYDSDPEHWFIGYEIPNYSTPDEAWFDKAHEEANKFEALTGVKARIRGGCHVW